MERYLGPQYTGLKPEITPSPEGQTTSLVWTLGSDRLTEQIALRLRYRPKPHVLFRLLHKNRWQVSVLVKECQQKLTLQGSSIYSP